MHVNKCVHLPNFYILLLNAYIWKYLSHFYKNRWIQSNNGWKLINSHCRPLVKVSIVYSLNIDIKINYNMAKLYQFAVWTLNMFVRSLTPQYMIACFPLLINLKLPDKASGGAAGTANKKMLGWMSNLYILKQPIKWSINLEVVMCNGVYCLFFILLFIA